MIGGRMRIPRGCMECQDCHGEGIQLHRSVFKGLSVVIEVACGACGGSGYQLSARERRRRIEEGHTSPAIRQCVEA